MATRNLTCHSCSMSAGRWKQWWNRDTGYGLCPKCAQWMIDRGMNAEEMNELHGLPGVHRAQAESEAAQAAPKN